MSLGVGVIGATGYIGTPYREEIRDCPDDAKIVALCARRRDLLEKAGEEDGASLITDDWRQVVEHPDVELVLICTPDALHREELLGCVENGKHVFCEKPVGLNVQEAWEMWSAVRDAGLGHYVPFWTRNVPVFARAREIVQAGTLGEVRAVIYRWHNPRPTAIPFTWRDDASLSSAGSIADVGSHAYDTMRWLLNTEAVRVQAHADVVSPAKPDLGAINLTEAIDWGGEHLPADNASTRKGTAFDYASVSFELENGAVGTLVLSHAPFLRKSLAPEVELHGTEASLAIDRISSSVTVARADGTEREQESIHDPGFGNRFGKHVFPALNALAAGDPTDHPGLLDGYRVQLFTDATSQSATSGQWVELSAIDPAE